MSFFVIFPRIFFEELSLFIWFIHYYDSFSFFIVFIALVLLFFNLINNHHWLAFKMFLFYLMTCYSFLFFPFYTLSFFRLLLSFAILYLFNPLKIRFLFSVGSNFFFQIPSTFYFILISTFLLHLRLLFSFVRSFFPF